MRWADFESFREAHPDLAEVLETRRAGNAFLISMYEKASSRKNFTPKMLAAIRRIADTPPLTEQLTRGENVTAELRFEKVTVKEYKGKVTRVFHFGATAGGWRGKLESNATELEDLFNDAGITLDCPTKIADPATYSHVMPSGGPVSARVAAQVAWVAPDGGFVILKHAIVMPSHRPVAVEPAPAGDPEPTPTEAPAAAPTAPEARVTPLPRKPRSTQSSTLPSFADWKRGLEL